MSGLSAREELRPGTGTGTGTDIAPPDASTCRTLPVNRPLPPPPRSRLPDGLPGAGQGEGSLGFTGRRRRRGVGAQSDGLETVTGSCVG